MEKTITVRAARTEDIPGIMELLHQVNDVHASGRPDIFIPGCVKYTEAELESILADRSHTPVWVAENDSGDVLGHCFSVIEDRRDSNNLVPGVSLYIDDICVSERARGKGVGRAIYNHVRAHAKKSGFDRITLNVWNCNPGAASFYKALGFTPLKETLEDKL